MKRLLLLLSVALIARAQPPERPRILGIAHVAFHVSDIEKSRAFYKDFLGFAEPFRLDNPDGSLSLTFIKINDRQYLELFPGLEPGADRLHHVALETDNAERMRVYLAAHGVKVPDHVPKGRIGNLNFNITDPDGHTIEIVEYAPDGWSMRDKGKFLPDSRISDHMWHAGILVGNLDAAMHFYGEILGFHEIWRGSSNGKTLSWVNMQVPDGGDYIEFMLYRDLPPGDKRGSEHHICLRTPDVAAAQAKLEVRPYRASYSRTMEPRTGINRKHQLNLFDPDGTRSELMEPVTVDGNPAPSSQAPPP
ncbi:MAG TPA: VOC family protein [Bryobacteraceae bacterium]|nr:VOC family protein [Bryobacteraceae bacterium]